MRVERHHARLRFLDAFEVSRGNISRSILFRQSLSPKSIGVQMTPTGKARSPRADDHHATSVSNDLGRTIDAKRDTEVDHRNEVPVRPTVQKCAGCHSVNAADHDVAGREQRFMLWGEELIDALHLRRESEITRISGGDLNFRLADVGRSGTDDARDIRRFDDVTVDEQQRADAQMRELHGDDRSDTPQTNDRDPQVPQPRLTSSTQCQFLS
jgi:hypothetical protein